MGEGKEGGGVTVCEDDDDGAVFLGRWDDNEVQTQDQLPRWGSEEGRGGECGMFNFFRVFRFLQFCYFFGCPFLASLLACLLFFVSYTFPLFLFLLLVGPFLFSEC